MKFQLPHYVHPVYALFVPLAAFLIVQIFPSGYLRRFADFPAARWLCLFVITLVWMGLGRSVSRTPNRGQEFIEVADRVRALDPRCQVIVTPEKMELYRMEAFALWYWRGRNWAHTPHEIPSPIALPYAKVYWDPQAKILWGNDICKI